MKEMRDKDTSYTDWSQAMKRDWDDRARQDAKWFINTARLSQPEKEFDRDGARDVEQFVNCDLSLLTQGRDPKQLKILELGCGIGRMTRHLASMFGEVHATDVSGEMINRAKERLAGISNATLYETNGYDLAGLPDDHFDIVLSAFVFRHVPTPGLIEENLHEAYRVLKPGGVMKFHTNSITLFDFEEMEKDTWLGASFPDSLIRQFARTAGARLIGIHGAGMKDCWTTLCKPEETAEAGNMGQPMIEKSGRADNIEESTVPTSGKKAAIALLVSGLLPEVVCCNSLSIEIGGAQIPTRYVGPPKTSAREGLVQIEGEIPIGTPDGPLSVSVITAAGSSSKSVTVEFYEPQPVIPRIEEVGNALDSGSDVYAHGAKSVVRLTVHGLDRTADTGNVRVQIGERILRPAYVGVISGNGPATGLHRVDAQLPGDIQPGTTDVRLYFGNLESPAATLEVLSV
jgi:2-polyprenyl-3-methyl-5-hydroxy-6-metoxy-1,4-benzoquinol methylase